MSYDSLVDPTPTTNAAELDNLTKDLQEAIGNNNQAKPDGTTPLNTRQMSHVTTIQDAPADTLQDANDPLRGTKFEGKDVADVLDAYNNLQSAYGRMANDLGTQRQLTDRLLDLNKPDNTANNPPQPIQVDSGQLLDNPTETLDKILSARDDRINKEVNDRLANIESGLRERTFITKHPDYQTIGNDPKFTSWVQADPIKARAAQAALGGDWDSADLLFTQYKAELAQQQQQATNNNNNVAPTTDVRQVALETSNSTTSTAPNSGKIYSRAALMRLRIERPDQYEDPAFQQEIMAAYAQGRVK